jgi:3-oxoacyl-[acyl-carrier-protein] synthase II
MGVVSPIGIGTEELWNSLVEGLSAIKVKKFSAGDNSLADRNQLVAEITGFEPKDFVKPRKALKVMAREIQTGFSAAMMATQQAGIEPGTIDPNRLGVLFGSELLFSESEQAYSAIAMCSKDGVFQPELWGEVAARNITPLWMLKSLPNMVACHVGIALDARGPNNTITTEETAALTATIEAISVIERGLADVMIVGASGNRIVPTRLMQRHESLFTDRHDLIAAACRPFDANRTGAVPGEAAAVIVIEKRSSAEARSIEPLCTISGWSNGFGIPSRPIGGSAAAVQRAIDAALARSGLAANDIGFVSAAANGSISLDSSEAEGISQSKLSGRPTTSFKAHFGDSGCGSGLLETCATALALQHETIPATLNFESPGADCPVEVVSGSAAKLTASAAMKISLTPHGQATTLLLHR